MGVMGLSREEHLNVCVALARYLPRAAGMFADALDAMVDRAEEWFGPRDGSFTVANLSFEKDYPQVSFPWPPQKMVWVRLSALSLRRAEQGDFHLALWQLAHEAVHLLSPRLGGQISVLEEGIACCFQNGYMVSEYPGQAVPNLQLASYIEAERLASLLLSLNPEVIEQARQAESTISLIDAATLRAYCPALPFDVAQGLERRFERAPRAFDGPWPFRVPKATAPAAPEAQVDGESWWGVCPPRHDSPVSDRESFSGSWWSGDTGRETGE